MSLPVLAQPNQGGGRGGQPQPRERQGGGPQGAGGPRQAMSPEKAKAAWELEAQSVAKKLGLSENETAALVKAYTQARESHNAATQALRERAREGGGGEGGDEGGRGRMREGMRELQELNAAERTKLEKSLGSSLSPEQTQKAVAVLGTFNRRWDQMVDTIAGFNLEGAKRDQALDAIEEFVTAQAKAMPGPGANREDIDPEALRKTMQESRQNLTTALKPVLSEDQMKQFETMLNPRGMGGRGEAQGEDNAPPRRRGRGQPGGGDGNGG
ncbi:MAG: hypothetical protein KF745_02630 [Phycisphaeraceae bacterium]|nr:hypothetical protein [Phycisphaeraceae bacterium]